MLEHVPFDGSVAQFGSLLDFLTECHQGYGWLNNWSICRLEDWYFGGNAQRAKVDPTFYRRNLHLWKEDGAVVGICVAEYGGQSTLMVRPERRDLEPVMLDWAEQNRRSKEGMTEVACWTDDVDRITLLRSRGYDTVESAGYLRRFDTSAPRGGPVLAEGYRFSTMAEFHDDANYVEAVREAFRRSSLDMEWFNSKQRSPSLAREWQILVLSAGNTVASFADVRIDRRAGYAAIDPIGTHPEHQRRGLSRALLLECFRRMSEDGIRHAYIGSAPEPTPSNRLYDSLEPSVKHEEMLWRKQVPMPSDVLPA